MIDVVYCLENEKITFSTIKMITKYLTMKRVIDIVSQNNLCFFYLYLNVKE